MFNLLPGQGLGFTASKLMAFGLGYVTAETVVSGGGGVTPTIHTTFYDDGYYTLHRLQKDDNEVVEILTVIAASEVLE